MSESTETGELASKLREDVRELFIVSAPGVDEVAWVAEEACVRVLGSQIGAGVSVEEAASAAAGGCVEAQKKLGCSMWHAARGAVFGVARAARIAESDPAAAMEAALRTMVSELLAADGDFGAAGKGSVQGGIEAAEALELSVSDTCAHLAAAAVEVAMSTRTSAGHRMTEILRNPVGGIPTGI